MRSSFWRGGLRDRLTTLQHGADALADGSRKLADGVQLLVDQVKQMGGGLSQASGFLLAMKYDAKQPSMAGFYVPPQAFTRDEFKQAAGAFISPDGHATRYLVQTELNPFSTAAMDQVNSITNTARGSQPNTETGGCQDIDGGFSAGLRDTRDYYNHDIRFFVLATIIIVLLMLIVLLRAIVAAAISDLFGDDFVPVGPWYRRHRVSVHSRPGIALERSGIDLHTAGRDGC